MIVILFILAIAALLVATAAIYMALIKIFPVRWLYYHYFIRKPVVWSILTGSLLWVAWIAIEAGSLQSAMFAPLVLMVLAVLLTYRMHQSTAFPAVDFPNMSDEPFKLPIMDDMQLAVIEYAGVTKAYPLDYVIHHHIINDHFAERIVALTYCAMCRSIIPFDVTAIGPLFVGSFKDANMIVADQRSKTFFQQATFASLIGPLHPSSLQMIPFQILPWAEIKRLRVMPQVCAVSETDFGEFQLPIPGIWKKIIASEATPGMPVKEHDKQFSARTRVIGFIDPIAKIQFVYLKQELIQQGIVRNQILDVFLVAAGETVNAFKAKLAEKSIDLRFNVDNELVDDNSSTVWDVRGKYKHGSINSDLELFAISDEYWFSWKAFHPSSQLIRL